MKVLFVSSGNTKDGITHLVRNQGQSLINQGIAVDFFTIKGKGIWSYFRHIFILRKYLKANIIDIVHSHYSLSAYVAFFSGANPLVVSLTGSDVKSHRTSRQFIRLFQRFFWDKTIVKSNDMFQSLSLKDIEIIPNGVNIVRIIPLDKKECQDKLKWDNKKSHIIFSADPSRSEKNFSLARDSFELLQPGNDIIMHIVKDVPHEEIPIYLNAADVLILSSLHEGSPNIIKEAMACNCPIVSVDVGDVKEIFGKTKGCYICSYDPKNMAEKIKLCLSFGKRTNGRERIIEMKIDEEAIAKKIISVYSKLIE